ncbi:hypothetical protein [uncultured Flavobacterium sp.]|uniref:hypothetical protein n=1 Tax=uncultured Flavobacterium sp. TaxID=165435 RepID=UPI0030C7FFD0
MNWSYLFKHWFGTLIISPFVYELFNLMKVNSNRVIGLVEIYPITFIFSLIFSIPTYIIYGFIYYFLARNEVSIMKSKIILLLFTVLSILLTFHIVFNARELTISISYAVTSIILGIYFKLNFKESK